MAYDRCALIVVDVQNDFCPGGALGVEEGDAVVPVANDMMSRFPLVVVTQDWHPPGHSSFASSHDDAEPFSMTDMPYGPQVLWPDHCVQDTDGAAFHKNLEIARAHIVIRKGFRPEIDSYSTFFENDRRTSTGLEGYLNSHGVQHIFMVGLATDYCVYYSAIDARRLGYKVTVISDGCRAIDLDGSLDEAMNTMTNASVDFVQSASL